MSVTKMLKFTSCEQCSVTLSTGKGQPLGKRRECRGKQPGASHWIECTLFVGPGQDLSKIPAKCTLVLSQLPLSWELSEEQMGPHHVHSLVPSELWSGACFPLPSHVSLFFFFSFSFISPFIFINHSLISFVLFADYSVSILSLLFSHCSSSVMYIYVVCVCERGEGRGRERDGERRPRFSRYHQLQAIMQLIPN